MTALAMVSLVAAILAIAAWNAARTRAATAESRADRLESESLEQRRELWKLSKFVKSSDQGGARDVEPSGSKDPLAALAPAVMKVAGELHEARVLESIVHGVVAATGAHAARIVIHDRKTDRFGRGPGARRVEARIEIGDEQPRPIEDAVIRSAMKRRARIQRDPRDPALRAAFDPTVPDLAFAAPLFDRAIAAAVLLVEHEAPTDRGGAIDVFTAIGSLALSNARLRAGVSSPECSTTMSEGDRHA